MLVSLCEGFRLPDSDPTCWSNLVSVKSTLTDMSHCPTCLLAAIKRASVLVPSFICVIPVTVVSNQRPHCWRLICRFYLVCLQGTQREFVASGSLSTTNSFQSSSAKLLYTNLTCSVKGTTVSVALLYLFVLLT